MDPSTLLPPFVSVLTTALIAALKDRSVQTFENKTKRVQFWKTMLEAASLADVTDVSFMKEQCQCEMAEAVNAVAIESNKFVGDISTMLVLGVEVLITGIMARISMDMLATMRQQGAPLEALRLNRRLQGAAGLLTIFIVMGVLLWLSRNLMSPLR